MSDTNDIPQRLRDLRRGDYSRWLLDSAANEITRLRAELAALKAPDPINDASEEACGELPCEGEAMSETPRTDARVFSVGVEVRGHDGEPQTEYVDVVYEGFAQELERELAAAKAEVAKANAERDEARRSACLAKARYLESIDGFPRPTDDEIGIKARAIARGMGWDCFAPHANTTDVPVQNGGE
jgi:hypothetical protein